MDPEPPATPSSHYESARKKVAMPMCVECLSGSHQNCENPALCPCCCNDSTFELNQRH